METLHVSFVQRRESFDFFLRETGEGRVEGGLISGVLFLSTIDVPVLLGGGWRAEMY